MRFKEVECKEVDRIHLANDRVNRQAPVKRVKNVQFPYNAKNFTEYLRKSELLKDGYTPWS